MRLWHESLIPQLPRPQLLGQHRECCALRGNGWGRKHATVDYVFTHSPYRLYAYHDLIMGRWRVVATMSVQSGWIRTTVARPALLMKI